MNGRKLGSITAVLLMVLGCILLGGVAYEWWPCFSGYTPACASASATSTSALVLLTAWVTALAASFVGFSVAVHKGRAFVGVVVLLCLNPITDRGAVFIPWDTADIIPFTGGWIALGTLTAGIAIAAGLRTKYADPETADHFPSMHGEDSPPAGTAPPRPSLIQQRMQLERARWRPRWWLCGGVILAVTNLSRVVTSATAPWWDLVGVAVGVGLVAVGVVQQRTTRRLIRAFEREHGPRRRRTTPCFVTGQSPTTRTAEGPASWGAGRE